MQSKESVVAANTNIEKSKMQPTFLQRLRRRLVTRGEWQLYLLILPTVIYFIIFHYIPMYGIQIAFRNYSITKPLSAAKWVGFQYFERFLNSPMFPQLFRNTLILSFYDLFIGFPFPVIFAVVLNQTQSKKLVKFTQTVTFAPYFISMVVLVGMLNLFLSPTTGLVNKMLGAFGIEPVYFMAEPQWFRHVYVFSNVWQRTGYQAIIYFAALTSVDPELYEAATIDGATRLQKIWYIDLPSITPTVVTMLLLAVGKILNVDTQRTLLMQAPTNLVTSEIFGTYVYKVGLINTQFSYSTAIDLFKTLINLTLLIVTNQISRKLTDESLW
ncbi:sugar ABC transporter permease [Thermoclostridium stercorarium subsp. leptospartum DSM 9219]|uniref:Sugar ABC transporter permease n=1 Tax=Thermoclostridium stercorarium subsp. leptospartum DSM 9219 TaxID=1346611 RepID=A0A1B1YJM0_THEST|nr:ABC transporter permease subunit [Thermoclostridium stercorarium]ANX00944.1 sugar ABC transporter permease [Thermoclostridium stercorarium subsp. leptospartum DSM 9219]